MTPCHKVILIIIVGKVKYTGKSNDYFGAAIFLYLKSTESFLQLVTNVRTQLFSFDHISIINLNR